MKISIVIRTLNEEKYLEELLDMIDRQYLPADCVLEKVLIDSGSTDRTLDIARKYCCQITYIKKESFSFGRSLNMGSDFSNGEILVYVSGHCIPENPSWLASLIAPLANRSIQYVYGKQIGRDKTKYSERRFFERVFPDQDKLPQDDYWCNNANSAILRSVWDEYKFDEEITGLEDMELAKRLWQSGGKIGYVSRAAVYHIHNESWPQIKNRYMREAIAMQKIEGRLALSFIHLLKYLFISFRSDFRAAWREGQLIKNIMSIIKYRSAQYIGTYKGGRKSGNITMSDLERFYYP